MAQPYVGEIRLFAGNFAPAGWEFCDGRLLPISEYETLFFLIGTTYGGDGESTYGLPDLRGRVPVHQGRGPGLSSYVVGESGGAERVTLTASQIPAHGHTAVGSAAPATTRNPGGALPAAAATARYRASNTAVPVAVDPRAISPSGGGQPHDNVMPFLTLNYIISLFGIFPSPT